MEAEKEKKKKLEGERKEKERKESERQNLIRMESHKKAAEREAKRISALKRLNEENEKRLQVIEENKICPKIKVDERNKLEMVTKEARRQSIVVNQIETDFVKSHGFHDTLDKISQLETSVASLD